MGRRHAFEHLFYDQSRSEEIQPADRRPSTETFSRTTCQFTILNIGRFAESLRLDGMPNDR